MSRRFEQIEVEKHGGISRDTQADWRRRKLTDEIGFRNSSGRWVYRPGDVARIVLGRWIIDRGIAPDVSTAFAIAGFLVPYVWARLENTPDRSWLKANYAVAFVGSSGLQVETLTDINGFSQLRYGGAITFDLNEVAFQMAELLKWFIEQSGVTSEGNEDQ